MFTLTSANVHYGASSYPLNGLPESLQQVNCIDELRTFDLTMIVGQLTGFPREFTLRHIERQEFPGIKTKDGHDLVIPEHLYASANGYSLRWDLAA